LILLRAARFWAPAIAFEMKVANAITSLLLLVAAVSVELAEKAETISSQTEAA